MLKLTDEQKNNLSKKIYELLMGATLPCECGAECSLGMGEMGEATDEADRIVNEWIEAENQPATQPVVVVSERSYYYSKQLADVMNENVLPKYAPAVKVFSNGNGIDTNTMDLNNESAKELIFWLAKNFVNMGETGVSFNGVTILF